MAEVTPVTVLTGAVGSGPASMAHQILSNVPGLRVAVIVDETSGLSADTAQPKMECLCCTPAVGGTAAALRALLPRARRDDVTHVLVELRGRADAGRIRLLFRSNPLVSAAFRLEGVVAIVDAGEPFGVPAARTVEAADRVLITPGLALDAAEIYRKIQSIRPDIPIAIASPGADFAGFALYGARGT